MLYYVSIYLFVVLFLFIYFLWSCKQCSSYPCALWKFFTNIFKNAEILQPSQPSISTCKMLNLFPVSCRRDQRVPWSGCARESLSLISRRREGGWVWRSSWREWKGTRELLCASANVTWVRVSDSPWAPVPPLDPSALTQDQYVTPFQINTGTLAMALQHKATKHKANMLTQF